MLGLGAGGTAGWYGIDMRSLWLRIGAAIVNRRPGPAGCKSLDAIAAVLAWWLEKKRVGETNPEKDTRQVGSIGGSHRQPPAELRSAVALTMSSAERDRWFAEQIRPHEPALRAYLSKRFPSHPDHDDLVQETFARVLRHANPARMVFPRAYLFITARNAAVDYFRRQQSHPHEALEDMPEVSPALIDETPSVVESLESRQRREVLIEALRALPERCREVMLLRYLDGCSSREIAARLGVSVGTVKGHLLKGKRDCTRFFEQRGLVQPAPAEAGRDIS